MGAIDAISGPRNHNDIDKYQMMYRLPSRPSEEQQRYFNLKYQMSHYLSDITTVRTCCKEQIQSASTTADCCSRIARFYHSFKVDKAVHNSRDPAVYCVTDTDWVDNPWLACLAHTVSDRVKRGHFLGEVFVGRLMFHETDMKAGEAEKLKRIFVWECVHLLFAYVLEFEQYAIQIFILCTKRSR